jgi:guanine deaminase
MQRFGVGEKISLGPTMSGDNREQISFMRQAIDLSIENVKSRRGGPFGALIVKDKRVIATGTNLVSSTNDPTAHAEIVAIREACRVLHDFQLSGCDVYASCEPCPMCLAAFYWARPNRIYYAGTREDAAQAGFDDSYIYEQLALPIPKRAIAMTQLMREEALAAFRFWGEQPDKRPY